MLWLEATSLIQELAAEVLLLLPALHHKHRVMLQVASPSLLPSLRYCSAVVTHFAVSKHSCCLDHAAALLQCHIMPLLSPLRPSLILTWQGACVGLHIQLTDILHPV